MCALVTGVQTCALPISISVIGPVMVLVHLAGIGVAAGEGAILVGGLSALGAALFSIGIPKDSVIQYEQAVKADGFLVVAHGSSDEMARSKAIRSEERRVGTE